jgi:hypothetical protein
MILSLDVRRARKGDCLILHYGTKEDPGLVLIDGGPSQVYTPQLKPRLAQIRQARNLAADDPLPVNLMMVSHIDDDHINGILELTKELITATDEKKPLPLRVRNLWHNSFDDIIGNSPKELLASVTASFGAAGLLGELDSEGFDAHTARVLASVGQGFRLRDDAKKLKLQVNKQFGGLVMADKKDPVDFGNGLQFTVAGPMKAELVALQKQHDAFLKTEENKKNKEALASFTDTSVANLSSLVLLAEVDKKRILLTGDARGDKILEGLELVNVLPPGGEMHIDILKVPHHGSDRNMETGFFKRVTADHYVFSGNGEHGNPERETLKMLLEARGSANYAVHLTYPVDEIDKGRKADWEKEQAKEKVRKQSKPNTEVREDWSPDEHSVTAFLNANKEFAKKIRIVAQDRPHVIDLHEALGY